MKKKLYLCLIVFLMAGMSLGAQENNQTREAVLEDVTRSREGIVLALRSIDTIDRIHIVVGESEGWSISLALRKEKFARPLTHDLFKSFLVRNGWRVEKVVIRDIQRGAFLADLVLDKDGVKEVFDARPSDAIALGVRFGAKIFISEKVLKLEREREKENEPASDRQTNERRL